MALEEAIRVKKIRNMAALFGSGLVGSGLWQGDLAEMREDQPVVDAAKALMILVDTSIWIRLFRDATLGERLGERILECATCPPVMQEVFQGLYDGPRTQKIREGLLALPRVADPLKAETFLAAAEILRLGRRKGLTIRSSYDCLIAAIAIEHQCAVWHHDRDFEHIAAYTSLRLIRPA